MTNILLYRVNRSIGRGHIFSIPFILACLFGTFIPTKCWSQKHPIKHSIHSTTEKSQLSIESIIDVCTVWLQHMAEKSRSQNVIYFIYINAKYSNLHAKAVTSQVLNRLNQGNPRFADYQDRSRFQIYKSVSFKDKKTKKRGVILSLLSLKKIDNDEIRLSGRWTSSGRSGEYYESTLAKKRGNWQVVSSTLKGRS